MDEQVASQSISARIAALKIDHIARTPGQLAIPGHDSGKARSNGPPPLPSRPTTGLRRDVVSDSPVYSNGSITKNRIGNEPIAAEDHGISPPVAVVPKGREQLSKGKPPLPPRLPPRRAIADTTRPHLPNGHPASQLKTKSSFESVSSNPSSRSSVSAASTGTAVTRASTPSSSHGFLNESNIHVQPRKLPPILPRSTKEPAEHTATSSQRTEAFQATAISIAATSLNSKVPPPLPTRRVTSVEARSSTQEPPTHKPKRSALSFGLNEPSETPSKTPAERPAVPARALTDIETNGLPPPIPLATKPSSTAVQTSKNISASSAGQICLRCRDFTAPDEHATRFPRHTVPSASTEWLAYQLTSPFPSLTDKARVVFTWLHHNIEYDVISFFNDTVKPSTPASTISTGLAVCEGYAGLFTAIASHAGLESVVVGGHGKGYGHSSLAPNSPIPPFSTGHAWNAVKIDGNEWKLIDCCWGAGAVSGKGQPYIKRFAPSFFTMDNNEFGRRHFPQDPSHFFCNDGRRPPTWEEYLMSDSLGNEPPQVFTGAEEEHGLDVSSFQPRLKKIVISSLDSRSETIRFQFSKKCPHWDFETMGKGKPYLFIIRCGAGQEEANSGIKKDLYRGPFETNGETWWCDIPVEDLGSPGQTVTLFTVATVGGEDARGMTASEYLAAKARKGMGFGGVAAWELL